MNPDKPDFEALEVPSQNDLGDGGEGTKEIKLSRLERLKRKIKMFRRKDPDIYPMW